MAGCPEAEVVAGRGEDIPRAVFSGRVRAFLDRQLWDQVDLPLICRCLRSTRLTG